ncbi:hypothetical protein CHUAL_000663 [Chamberlinius hualienensis]
MDKFLLGILLVAIGISYVNSLECYVCDRQEDNEGKCIKTVQQCNVTGTTDGEQPACLSHVKWGSMPYWTQGAPKQYFISKECSTKTQCERIRRETTPKCDRIGYNDWECSECCQGDRCNYFITLSGSSIRSSWLIIFGCFGLIFTLWTFK